MARKARTLAVIILALLLLSAAGWFGVTQSGLLQPAHWQQPSRPVPLISTRGHLRHGQLSAGCDKYGYDVLGGLPGLAPGTAGPRDLLIVVHGFNNSAEKAVYKFGIAQESLARAGFDGAVAGYSWDADTQKDPLAITGYHEGLRNAAANGPMLARFIVDYAGISPRTRLHLLGYSMGARLVLEALDALAADPRRPPGAVLVSSVHLVGAAVGNEDVELGGRYGRAIQTQCGRCYNYFSPEDNKLGYYFPLKEGDRALGITDIEHAQRRPANYTGVDATRQLPKFDASGKIDVDEYGDNHSGYLGTRDKQGRLIDNGAMDLVAGSIAGLR